MQKREQLSISLPIPNQNEAAQSQSDPNNQITLIFKNKHYDLPREILKTFSKLFQSVLTSNLHSYEIKLAFNEEILDNFISVFKGHTLTIDRSEVSQYYQIISFFETDNLKDQILQDINDQFQEYDTFAIMKLAHDSSNHQLFKKCLDELESQSFQQMKYHQLSLLSIDLNLFKLTVKSHNQFKGRTKKGLTYKNINDLIKLYCDSNGLSEEKIQELKLQLIQVSVLSSAEFKQIFMDPILEKFYCFRPNKVKSGSQTLDLKFRKKIATCLRNLTLSASSPQLKQFQPSIKEIKMFMQNIYLSKKAQQLERQNKKMEQQINQYKLKYPKKSKSYPHAEQTPEISPKIEDPKQKNKLNLLFSVIDKMSEEFEEKIQEMNQIVCTYEQKIKEKTQKQSNQAETTTSQLSDLSCIVVHQMMTNNTHPYPTPKLPRKELSRFKKLGSLNIVTSSEETTSEPNIDNNICYNQLPTVIKSKSLPHLNKIIRPDGFRKLNLTLVYRRSNKYPYFGEKQDIFNRGHLLILIRTKQDIEVGGYVSAKLTKKQGQIYDKNAFIFNVEKNLKYKICSNVEKAIVLKQECFLNFSDDLIIPNDCLSDKSLYNYSDYRRQQSKSYSFEMKDDFGLPSEFYIQNLQIYETNQGEMEMRL